MRLENFSTPFNVAKLLLSMINDTTNDGLLCTVHSSIDRKFLSDKLHNYQNERQWT